MIYGNDPLWFSTVLHFHLFQILKSDSREVLEMAPSAVHTQGPAHDFTIPYSSPGRSDGAGQLYAHVFVLLSELELITSPL